MIGDEAAWDLSGDLGDKVQDRSEDVSSAPDGKGRPLSGTAFMVELSGVEPLTS